MIVYNRYILYSAILIHSFLLISCGGNDTVNLKLESIQSIQDLCKNIKDEKELFSTFGKPNKIISNKEYKKYYYLEMKELFVAFGGSREQKNECHCFMVCLKRDIISLEHGAWSRENYDPVNLVSNDSLFR